MKQKILRLTSDKQDGTFDTFINDDLVLKKDSKIALLNTKAVLTNLDFVIDNTNNKFGFMLDVDNDEEPVDVYLETNDYNDTNIEDFFIDWAQKHNRKVNNPGELGFIYNETVRGFEFSYKYQNDPFVKLKRNKFILGYGKTLDAYDLLLVNDERYVDNLNVQLDEDEGDLVLNDGFENGSLLFNAPLARGGGGFKFTVPNIEVNQYIIVGLVSSENLVELKNFSFDEIEKIRYGYKYEQGKITIIIDGILTGEIFEGYDAGDEFTIMYSNNSIIITYYDEPVYEQVHQGVNYNHQDYLFGVLLINNVQSIPISDNKCQVYSSWEYLFSLELKDSDIWNINKRWTKKRLYYSKDIDVLQQLGFNESYEKLDDGSYVLQVLTPKPPPEQPDGNYYYFFEADEKINIIDTTSSYIVELQNISLEFYDVIGTNGISGGQRKNYIMTFANQEVSNFTSLVYNAEYPIFINVKSVSDQVLRVIKARILREDGEEINTTGTSIITLLIQEE